MKNRAIVLNLGSLFVALFLIVILTVPVFAAKPIILPPYTLSIAENAFPGNTTTPNKINALAAETGLLTFDVLSGDGKLIFDVGLNSGIVTLAAGQSLDYETKKSYTLEVKVQDTELLTDTRTITINVTDVPDETPDLVDGQSFNIAENSPNNTQVGKILFSDADTVDSHTFTIEGGNGSGGGAFLIEPDAEIRVKDSAQLDHETTPQFL